MRPDLNSDDLEWLCTMVLAKKTLYLVSAIEEHGAKSALATDALLYWEKTLEGLRCLAFSAPDAVHLGLALPNEIRKAHELVNYTMTQHPGPKKNGR